MERTVENKKGCCVSVSKGGPQGRSKGKDARGNREFGAIKRKILDEPNSS